jgi:hypothetical protein
MNTRPNEPLRGPRYRSRAFQEYLLRQPPERAAEILAAEHAFNELQQDPGSVAGAAEELYHFDLTDTVPVDAPAGITDRTVSRTA